MRGLARRRGCRRAPTCHSAPVPPPRLARQPLPMSPSPFPTPATSSLRPNLSSLPDKDDAEIVSEIQAIIRQITASVTFLPLLNRPCERVHCLGDFATEWRTGSGSGWLAGGVRREVLEAQLAGPPPRRPHPFLPFCRLVRPAGVHRQGFGCAPGMARHFARAEGQGRGRRGARGVGSTCVRAGPVPARPPRPTKPPPPQGGVRRPLDRERGQRQTAVLQHQGGQEGEGGTRWAGGSSAGAWATAGPHTHALSPRNLAPANHSCGAHRPPPYFPPPIHNHTAQPTRPHPTHHPNTPPDPQGRHVGVVPHRRRRGRSAVTRLLAWGVRGLGSHCVNQHFQTEAARAREEGS